MSNEIMQLPAHLEKYRTAEPNMQQVGALDSSDIGLNMLKIVQSNSREGKRAGWGITGQEPMLAQGTMFLSKDANAITPGTLFIPLLRSVKYIKWTGKPGEGSMEFVTDDANDPRIKAINGLAFKKDPNSGMTLAPEVTKYVNFYIMVQGIEMPVLMSFKRTSTPEGKWLTNSCVMATQGNRFPFYTLMYKLNAAKTIRDGNMDWYALSMSANGYAPDDAIAKSKRMYELALSLNNLVGAELEGDHEEKSAPVAAVAAVAQTRPVVIQGHATVAPPVTSQLQFGPNGNGHAPSFDALPPTTVTQPVILPPAPAVQTTAPATAPAALF